MMKIIISLFVILLTFQAQSQYFFDFINEAEQCLIDKKYSEALDNYKTAFASYKYGRWNDYYNATLCAVKLDKKVIALQYFDSCLISGMTLSNFKNTEIETKLISTHNDSGFLEKWDSLVITGAAKKNTKLYQEFIEFEASDQQYLLHEEVNEERFKTEEFLHKNGLYLAKLIQENKIPDLELFGENFKNLAFIIIRHYFGSLNAIKGNLKEDDLNYSSYQEMINDSLLYNSLISLIEVGKCSPCVLRDGLIHFQPQKQFGNTCLYKYIVKEENGKSYQTKPDFHFYFTEDVSDTKVLEKYNKNRSKIGLPSFEEELRIVKQFTKENNYTPEFKFSYTDKNDFYFQTTTSNTKFEKKRKGIQVLEYNNKSDKWVKTEFVKNENVIKFSY